MKRLLCCPDHSGPDASAVPCPHSRWRCPAAAARPQHGTRRALPSPVMAATGQGSVAPLPLPALSQDGGGGGQMPCGQRAVKPL